WGTVMRGTWGRLALAALLLNGCLVWPGFAANAPGDAPGDAPGNAPASTLRARPGNTPAPSWPHAMNVHGANVVVYQPQAISWPEHQTLTARAAVSITPPGAPAPILGTIELTLAARTDAATDNVYFSDPHLVSSHFPTLDTAQA